jgi:hypothetical protein
MKKAQQLKRDMRWYYLNKTQGITIEALAYNSGYHRNTVSRAINKIRRTVRQKENHADSA